MRPNDLQEGNEKTNNLVHGIGWLIWMGWEDKQFCTRYQLTWREWEVEQFIYDIQGLNFRFLILFRSSEIIKILVPFWNFRKIRSNPDSGFNYVLSFFMSVTSRYQTFIQSPNHFTRHIKPWPKDIKLVFIASLNHLTRHIKTFKRLLSRLLIRQYADESDESNFEIIKAIHSKRWPQSPKIKVQLRSQHQYKSTTKITEV